MKETRSRQLTTFLLTLGAVAFGLVLAGGLEITPAAISGPAVVPAVSTVTTGSPASLPDFANLAQAVDPAVVSIQATSFDSRPAGQGNPFEFFFGPRQRRPGQPDSREPEQPFRQDAGGSGFVVSEDGLVVTNYHVIREAEDLKVVLEDRIYKATVRGTDPATDIALLKIDAPKKLTYLRLGDSDRLRVGEWVMAVGSPLELSHTVTVGVVSAKDRAIGINDRSFENFIQTDAAINFGNSGGPLINLVGEVVGINTAINSAAENIGFAVPSNTLKQILPQLTDSGKVRRGYLGISINNLDFESAAAYGLDTPDGALVLAVVPGQPAAKAGLKPEDIVTKVDEMKVKTTRDLIDYVSAKGPGSSVELEVLRDGKERNFTVKLNERDTDTAEPAVAAPEDGEKGIDWLGIRYQDLTPSLRNSHGLPEDVEGVWVTSVAPNSQLFEDGIRGNDLLYVITSVNGQPVADVSQFEKAVKAVGEGRRFRMYVRRFSPQGEELAPLLTFPQAP